MLGENIRKIRESLNISQRELARRIGKTGQYISYLENSDNSNPSLDVLNKIAVVLGVPLSKLTKTSIEDKINQIIAEKNISGKELSNLLGNIIQQSPTGEKKVILIGDTQARLFKISQALQVPFNILIEDTPFEDFYFQNGEGIQPHFKITESLDNNRFINHHVGLRIENDIPISVISHLLDIEEDTIRKFENDPDAYAELENRYSLIINDILKFREMLFNTLLMDIDIKQLFSIDEKKQYLLAKSLALYLNHQLEFEPKQKKLNIDKKLTLNKKINKNK